MKAELNQAAMSFFESWLYKAAHKRRTCNFLLDRGGLFRIAEEFYMNRGARCEAVFDPKPRDKRIRLPPAVLGCEIEK
jgi:hypothetical protein